MRRLSILALVLLATLVGAASASAAPSDSFQYKSSFGAGTLSNPTSIAVNEQTGNVLVLDNGSIYQFDADGKPVDFSATGEPAIHGVPGAGEVVVDNTGGPTQGNFYAIGGDQFSYWAYEADGTPLPGGGVFTPAGYPEFGKFGYLCGGTVASNGNLWLAFDSICRNIRNFCHTHTVLLVELTQIDATMEEARAQKFFTSDNRTALCLS
jgi:hypothetical protein